MFATGKSILDRSSRTNVGTLMLEYGGGGHVAAGTCQVANEDAEATLAVLIERNPRRRLTGGAAWLPHRCVENDP